MLIEFRVENHRSIRDEQVLTMEAGRAGGEADSRPRLVRGHAEKLLAAAALYGANASGKTNVLAALKFMRDAVLESQRLWSPGEGVPREPFAWGAKRQEPSMYEVTVLVEGVRYQYGFSVCDRRFLEEWLHAWPNGKKQTWFQRDERGFKFGDSLKGENRLIEDITRPNALFLSAAVQLRHEQLHPIYGWFTRLFTFNVRTTRERRAALHHPPTEWIVERWLEHAQQPLLFPEEDADESTLLREFRALLRNADFGILDLRVNRDVPDDAQRRSRGRIQFKHSPEDDGAWLWLEEESKGTQTLFHVGLRILEALQRGGLVVIDELESSLHPILARQIVRQFNEPSKNPRNAQLVFATHDTNLLGSTVGEPALRRDQIWFTEKTSSGATKLYPLTDYKPRKSENLERGYLQGRYGAIPFLGDLSVPEDGAP